MLSCQSGIFQEDNTYIEFLQKLCDETYQQSELNEFIEKLFQLSHSYIQFRFNQIKRIAAQLCYSSKDIAIEAIIPLFHKNTEGTGFVLTDEVRKWNPPIKTEKDAFFFLNKVISRRVEQHISFLLRESDPFFAKILNSVNYLIRSQGFVKANYIGKSYIVKTKININSKVIGSEEFESLPTELFQDKKKLLFSIFHHIKSETNFFPAIPLNELIIRLKEINLSGFLSSKDATNNRLKEIEIDEILRNGLNYIEKKLNESYISKGKLTEEEHVFFIKALTDMANDLKDGGLSPSLYEYFNKYFIKLTKEEYLDKYQNILEYLLRLLKEKIAEEINAN